MQGPMTARTGPRPRSRTTRTADSSTPATRLPSTSSATWPKLACGLLQELGDIEVVVVELEVVVGAAELGFFLLQAERLRAHVAGAPAVALALVPVEAGGDHGDPDLVAQ